MWIGVWYVFALSCLCSKSRSGKKTANLIFIWMGLRICHSSLWNIGDWQLWCYKLLKTISSSPISTGNAKMKWQMECQLAIRSELPAEHAEPSQGLPARFAACPSQLMALVTQHQNHGCSIRPAWEPMASLWKEPSISWNISFPHPHPLPTPVWVLMRYFKSVLDII